MSEINRREYLDRLAACDCDPDWEAAHVDADEVLCDLLCALGYADVVAAWEDISKWYA